MKKINYNQEVIKPIISFDLKAEVFYLAVSDKIEEDQNIVINHSGLFFRKFRKDIISSDYDLINDEIFNISTSRDGFYDVLPENFTHNDQNTLTNIGPVKEFKKRKAEEKEARIFFNPLENELFRVRASIEKFESDFLSNFSNSKISDIIRTILAVDDKIPDTLVVRLYYALLKQNKSDYQNINKIINSLENIIDEKVRFEICNIKLKNTHDEVNKNVELILGLNTTLESNESIFLKNYNFIVGPLKKSENLELFFQNQLMELFLTTFFNLFLPYHIQFTFEIILNKKDEQFMIDEKKYKSRLGISTVI